MFNLSSAVADMFGTVVLYVSLAYWTYRCMFFAGRKVHAHYLAGATTEYGFSSLLGDVGDSILDVLSKYSPKAAGRLYASIVAVMVLIAGVLMSQSWISIYGYVVVSYYLISRVYVLKKRMFAASSAASVAEATVPVVKDAP